MTRMVMKEAFGSVNPTAQSHIYFVYTLCEKSTVLAKQHESIKK